MLQSLLALILASAIAVAVYALLSMPGLIVLRLLRRNCASVDQHKYLLATIRSVLFTPVPFWSHTPLIVPPYVDVAIFCTVEDPSIKDVLLLVTAMAVFGIASLYWTERQSTRRRMSKEQL